MAFKLLQLQDAPYTGQVNREKSVHLQGPLTVTSGSGVSSPICHNLPFPLRFRVLGILPKGCPLIVLLKCKSPEELKF